MLQRRILTPRSLVCLILGSALAVALLPAANSQQNQNEREVRAKQTAVKDSPVWSLDFRFKNPRILKVHVPGRGTRICWYMWYQVINRTGQPRTFIPDFQLVTRDFPGVYNDEVLPSVQEEIKRLEDPNSYHDIKNSVTISLKPIAPSKGEDAFPRSVTGVAIWDGSKRLANGKDLADSVRFSVFVSGLSNGWVLVDPAGETKGSLPIIRRKTLQLNFRKVGDRFNLESREIQFVNPPQWTYRPARLKVPTPEVKKPMPK